jgi:hypothetical protein
VTGKPAVPDTFKVDINGTVHDLTPAMGDLVRWERRFGPLVTTADGGHNLDTTEKIAYLVWLMAVRARAIEPDVDFEAFLDALGDVEPITRPKVTSKTASPRSSPRRGLTGVA